jgi:hypothetical protein
MLSPRTDLEAGQAIDFDFTETMIYPTKKHRR